ncbi:hypothetical protein MSG28_009832, partial [Choristoneura fumiferana]
SCGQCRGAQDRAAAAARECARLTDALRDARDQLELMEGLWFANYSENVYLPLLGARDNLTDSDSGCVSPGSRIKDSASPELKRMDSGYKSPAPSSPHPRRHLTTPHDDFKEDFAKAQVLADILDRTSETSDSLKSNPVKDHLEQMILNAGSVEDRNCLEQVLMLLYNLQTLSSSVSEDECYQIKPKRICDLKSKLESDIPSHKIQKAIATVTPYQQKGYKCESLESLCSDERKPSNVLQESGIFEGSETETRSTQTDVNDSFECSGELNTEIQRLNSIREKLERQGVRNRTLNSKEEGDGLECKCVKLGKKHKQYYERRLKFLEGKISIYEAAQDVKEAKLAQRLQTEYILENRIQELELQLSELQDKYERLEEECCELEEIENDTRLHWQQLEMDYELCSAQLRDMTEQRECSRAQAERLMAELTKKECALKQKESELRTRLSKLERAVPALIAWNVVKTLGALMAEKRNVQKQTEKITNTLEKRVKELEEELETTRCQIRATKCACGTKQGRLQDKIEDLEQKIQIEKESKKVKKLETERDMVKKCFEPIKKKLREIEESESGLKIALEKSERDSRHFRCLNQELETKVSKAETDLQKSDANFRTAEAAFKKELDKLRKLNRQLDTDLKTQREATKRTEVKFAGDFETLRKELNRTCKSQQDLEVTNSELKEEVESLEKQLALTQKALTQCKRKCEEKIKTLSHELSIKTEELEELRSETMRQSFHASRIELKPDRNEYVDEGYSIYTAVPKKTDYDRMHHSMSYITSDSRCSCPSMRSQLVGQLIEDLFDRIHNTVDDDLTRVCKEITPVTGRDMSAETKAKITNYLLMAISKELVRSIGDADAKTDTEEWQRAVSSMAYSAPYAGDARGDFGSLRLEGNAGVLHGAARLASVSCACAAARLCAAVPEIADGVKVCQEEVLDHGDVKIMEEQLANAIESIVGVDTITDISKETKTTMKVIEPSKIEAMDPVKVPSTQNTATTELEEQKSTMKGLTKSMGSTTLQSALGSTELQSLNVVETDDDSCDEDEEDNRNLLMLKNRLTSSSNHESSSTQIQDDTESDDEHVQKFEMRIKVMGMRLKRREEKVYYLKTVLNMIKKTFKGTDMEYKLSCELENISKFSESIKSRGKNKRPITTESLVDDCVIDDEESSGDENGTFYEVALSPNLKPQNRVQIVNEMQKFWIFGDALHIDIVLFQQYKNTFREQFGIAPVIPETIEKLKELKRIICQSYGSSDTRLENTSSYDTARGKSKVNLIENSSDEAQWQNVENTNDLHKFIPRKQVTNVPSRQEEIPDREKNLAVNGEEEKIMSSEKVNVLSSTEEKLMLTKEVKIVTSLEDDMVPTKEVQDTEERIDDIAMIPSGVKRNYDIVEEDLNNLNKKEIEIIDEHLPENRSLLEDLKKVLRRNQVLKHKKERSLDLMYLYEIAKRQHLPLDEEYLHNNVLSREELDEIKEMILKKSVSSIHGVSRRKVKNRNTQGDGKDSEVCEISNSLIMELMREDKVANK